MKVMEKKGRLLLVILILFAMGLNLTVCGDDFPTIPEEFQCEPTSGDVDVAGRWVFNGSGVRNWCLNDDNNGFFTLSSMDIEVTQDGTDLTANLGNFELCGGDCSCSGTCDGVNGDCVTFFVSETIDTWGMTMVFDGRYSGNTIMGQFVGMSTDGCRIENGTFTVTIY
ncbi:hypothetical protein ACFL4G_00890 [Thermodesulfobacteriota bacterium]